MFGGELIGLCLSFKGLDNIYVLFKSRLGLEAKAKLFLGLVNLVNANVLVSSPKLEFDGLRLATGEVVTAGITK